MNGNMELLNYIYQNAQMGTSTIEQLLGIAQDEAFRRQLQTQHDEYKAITEQAQTLLHDNGCDEKGLSAFEKIRTYLMINMQTLADKSSSHIAEMMIIGSNMGVIDAIKNSRKYRHADVEILALMEKLRLMEENNINALKAFL